MLSHFRIFLPNQVFRLYTQLLRRLRVYLQFLDQDLGQFLADLLTEVRIGDVRLVSAGDERGGVSETEVGGRLARFEDFSLLLGDALVLELTDEEEVIGVVEYLEHFLSELLDQRHQHVYSTVLPFLLDLPFGRDDFHE